MKYALWALLALLLLVGFSAMSSYNGFVSLEEGVDAEWSNVETQYQRRFDLIPEPGGHCQGARRLRTGDPDGRDRSPRLRLQRHEGRGRRDRQHRRFPASNMVLGGAMNGMLGYSERYPELKANQNFSDLQAQLEGTENRISVARKKFNDTVKGYNGKVRRFPGALWAGMFGFEQREYFESVEGSEAAPTVDFGS